MSAEIYTTSPALTGALVATGGSLLAWNLGGVSGGAVVALAGVVAAASVVGLVVSATQGSFRYAALVQAAVLLPALLFCAWLTDDAARFGALSTAWSGVATLVGAAALVAAAARALTPRRSP